MGSHAARFQARKVSNTLGPGAYDTGHIINHDEQSYTLGCGKCSHAALLCTHRKTHKWHKPTPASHKTVKVVDAASCTRGRTACACRATGGATTCASCACDPTAPPNPPTAVAATFLRFAHQKDSTKREICSIQSQLLERHSEPLEILKSRRALASRRDSDATMLSRFGNFAMGFAIGFTIGRYISRARLP